MIDLGYRIYRVRAKVWPTIVRMLPKRLKYWVLIDASKHILPHEEVPAVPLTVIVERASHELNERSR